MRILGISSYYHDSAAAIIEDGKIICAAEEERFTRIKHDNNFPFNAARFCLKKAGISINDIPYIAYYEKPLLKFERILETFVATYPFSLKPFLKGIPEWMEYKIKVGQTIRKKLKYKGEIIYIPHHISHAAAAFYPSGFAESAILTADAVGEYQTTGLWNAVGNKITPLKSINFPNSLGLLYSTFTSFLGFKVNEDEYKVMGLSAYGRPRFTNKIRRVIDIKEDGSFCLAMKYFYYRESFTMWGKEFEGLFGKPRKPNEPILKRHKDIAASLQEVVEKIYFKMLNHLYDLSKSKNLCIGGGIALNALANGKIYSKTPFENVYVLGAAGDSGGAIGATLYLYHSILNYKKRHKITDLTLGSEYDESQIEQILKGYKLKYKKFNDENQLIDLVARYLSRGEIIGWFQGRMEFGPRALGARSILSAPYPKLMKDKVNKTKGREEFRPFAGSVLREKVHEYFEVPERNLSSPFMTFCFQVREQRKKYLDAIVHQDGTSRIQTVSRENGKYYKLIKRFGNITGRYCILNTSFNLRGEPIVESPREAIEDFLKTEMDYLVLENFLVSKA